MECPSAQQRRSVIRKQVKIHQILARLVQGMNDVTTEDEAKDLARSHTVQIFKVLLEGVEDSEPLMTEIYFQLHPHRKPIQSPSKVTVKV